MKKLHRHLLAMNIFIYIYDSIKAGETFGTCIDKIEILLKEFDENVEKPTLKIDDIDEGADY